jgi:5'-nucleotidase/UDP-sugar diphosphatase
VKGARVQGVKWLAFLAVMVLAASSLGSSLTIVHTNDLHSHVQGFGPELDYTPASTADDDTSGGFARIATVVRTVRSSRQNPVLVLDAGDFTMGSLFHTVSPQLGGELRLLGAMGYDAVTLGNHEFDLKPSGLAAILRAARSGARIPAILASNVVFDASDPSDDELERAFQETPVLPHVVLERAGLRVGILGVMGRRAAEVAPFARPVKFSDPVEASRLAVEKLRGEQRVDLVVCLAHMGISESGEGESARLAREVPGIDVIVDGHTHSLLPEPVLVGKTWIVQAGSYGTHVGVLDLSLEGGRARLVSYELIHVDDSIPGDAQLQAQVETLRGEVDRGFLAKRGLSYQEPLAKVAFPITDEPWGDSNLGDLVSDAIRWALDRHASEPGRPGGHTHLAVESGGLLRDPILPGKSGILALCDLFRAFPLGFGPDGEMGYPLLAVYMTGAEIRKALEVHTTVAPMKGSDYRLRISGLRFAYNPNRLPFDRVTDLWLEGPDGKLSALDASSANPTLYRVGVNLYNASFLKIIGRFTHGLLEIQPKDSSGRPLHDLKEALVDKDPASPGIQELKEWEALVDFVRQFQDLDGDGLADVPSRYSSPQGRALCLPTWNPLVWFRNPGWITWAALGVILGALLLLLWAIRLFCSRKH